MSGARRPPILSGRPAERPAPVSRGTPRPRDAVAAAAELVAPLYDFAYRRLEDAEGASAITIEALVEAVERAPAGEAAPGRVPAFAAAWRLLEAERVRAGLHRNGSLDPRAAAVLDLRLRHGFEAQDVGRVLGVSTASAEILVRRSRARAEALATRARPVALSGAALLVPPPGLIAECSAAVRTALERRPRMLAPVAAGAPPRRPGTRLPWFLAGLAGALALLGGFLFVPSSPIALVGGSSDGGTVLPAGAQTATATPTRTATRAATVRPSPSPRPSASARTAPSASPTATSTAASTQTPTARPTASATPTGASATPTATSTPTPTAAPTATPTPTPTPTETPCVPVLATNLSGLNIPAAQPTTTITVFNQSSCGSATYAVEAASSWIDVEPAIGTIPAFKSIELNVTVNPPEAGPNEGSFRIAGPGNTVLIAVHSEK